MARLGIGLVGLGRWGQNYLRTLGSLDSCRVVATADSAPAAGANHTDWRRLLDNPDVAAVVVATPDETHFPIALAALAAGRDVLVEKPMATNRDEASALVNAARAHSSILAVGHTPLYHPDFDALTAVLANHGLGRITRLAAIRTSGGVKHRQSNVLWDLVPHDLALAITLAGRPAAVRLLPLVEGDRLGYEVEFAGGVTLTGWAEWRNPPQTRLLRVHGSKSTFDFSDARPAPEDPPLTRLCRDFIGCSTTRRAPLSNSDLGLTVTECLDALARAAPLEWRPLSASAREPEAAGVVA